MESISTCYFHSRLSARRAAKQEELGFGLRVAGSELRRQGSEFGVLLARAADTGQYLEQCVGQHILLDVQGAVLALVVQQ